MKDHDGTWRCPRGCCRSRLRPLLTCLPKQKEATEAEVKRALVAGIRRAIERATGQEIQLSDAAAVTLEDLRGAIRGAADRALKQAMTSKKKETRTWRR